MKFFVRFSIDMIIGRYIRHYLEISLILLYTLNLAISGTKVSLFQWTLSYLDSPVLLNGGHLIVIVNTIVNRKHVLYYRIGP